MAIKKASESATKSAAEASTQPKAMDIHPVGTAPTMSTGRPVIVGNKTLANDPMLSSDKQQAANPATSNENASGDATTAPVISQHTKTISPASEEPLLQENDAVAKSVEALGASDKTDDSTVSEELDTADKTVAEASEDATAKPLDETETPGSDEVEPEQKGDEPSHADKKTEPEIDESVAPLVEEESLHQEKTAEQLREEQIEALIQKRTYAVPVDKTGRRRQNAVLALLFVLVSVVITFNFLLDLGVITVPGAPSTDFFAPKSL